MGKHLGEILNNIMSENSTRRAVFLTEQMYILGTIHDYHENCKNCHDCLIALKDVKIAGIKALDKCRNREETCTKNIFTEYRWFNISTDAVVGFSILDADDC